MTRNELNKILCAVITTLDEVDFAPESSLYLGIGANLSDWMTVKTILSAGNLATFNRDEVRIAPAGHAMAEKINALANIR